MKRVSVGRAMGHSHTIPVDKEKGTTSRDYDHAHTFDWSRSFTSKDNNHNHRMPARPDGKARRLGGQDAAQEG